MVCLVDTHGVSHVLHAKTWRERWHDKAVDVAWYGYLVRLSWGDDAHVMMSRVDPRTGRTMWTVDAMASRALPVDWWSTYASWGPAPGGQIGVNIWIKRKKGGPERLVGVLDVTRTKRTVLTFRPVDEKRRRLATATPGMHIPVLSYEYDEPDVNVTVRGRQRSMNAHFGLRPLDNGNGELLRMPRAPLPDVLHDPWGPLGSVIDIDAHAIMEPVS